jgi:hypothetical protein
MRVNMGRPGGHECLAKLVQGTVCKILDAHAVKPHRLRYYLERRDPEFEEKMAPVLCIYREVEILKEATTPSDAVAIISYDEKPGVQAIGSTAPHLPPNPGDGQFTETKVGGNRSKRMPQDMRSDVRSNPGFDADCEPIMAKLADRLCPRRSEYEFSAKAWKLAQDIAGGMR